MRYVSNAAFAIAALTLFVSTAFGQWTSDTTKNTPVCTASGVQENPLACTDGNNGVIVVWQDFRSNHWDVYAQHLDSYGNAKWTANGVLLCNTTTSKDQPVIATDDSGGAYIVWRDARRGGGMMDLYGQHIKYDGTLLWGAKGLAVDSVPNAPSSATISSNPVISDDGLGNAFVIWEDNRTAIQTASRPDLYMNKLGPNGPQFGKSGSVFYAGPGEQTSPRMVEDVNGGVFVAWVNSGTPSSITATRVAANGSISWGSGSGIQVYKGTAGSSDNSRNPQLSRDGTQYLVAWETVNTENTQNGWNVLANRFKADGTRCWGTATTAFEVSTDVYGDQTNPTIFSDDSTLSGGVAGFMCVYQSNQGKNYIVLTRGIGDGLNYSPNAPNNIFTVSTQLNSDGVLTDLIDPVAVKTGTGEVLTAWIDSRLSSSNAPNVTSIYAQRVDRSPKRYLPTPLAPAWGVPVSNKAGSIVDELSLVPRTNGAIAIWRDNRNGTNNQDIFAQLLFRDGTLPIELSSFDLANVSNGHVLVTWNTTNQTRNAGFEIERRLLNDPNANASFEVIASYTTDAALRGSGTSATDEAYQYVDAPGAAGLYEYRLADISLDGERTTHPSKTINVQENASAATVVGNASPNPFFASCMIPITLGADALVTVDLLDVLGRSVAMPYHATPMNAGTHELRIDAASLPANGSYYCTVTIADPISGAVVYTLPQAMLLQVLR